MNFRFSSETIKHELFNIYYETLDYPNKIFFFQFTTIKLCRSYGWFVLVILDLFTTFLEWYVFCIFRKIKTNELLFVAYERTRQVPRRFRGEIKVCCFCGADPPRRLTIFRTGSLKHFLGWPRYRSGSVKPQSMVNSACKTKYLFLSFYKYIYAMHCALCVTYILR